MSCMAGEIRPADQHPAEWLFRFPSGDGAGDWKNTLPAASVCAANEDNTIHLVFCGTIYNDRGLHAQLQQAGHGFRTDRVAEILIHLYEERGDLFARELDGNFVFGLWDARQHKLLLGRDRAGEKPLFYFRKGYSIAFAAELAALREHPDFPAEWSEQSVADFFSLQYVPPPRTVYREVWQLPPASIMRFFPESGRMVIEKYWDLTFLPKRRITFADAKAELRHLVTESVRKRLDYDGDFGVFLSGGVDSGIIASVTAGFSGQKKIRAFTIGFEDAAYDERPLARMSAAYIGQQSGGMLDLQEKTLPQIPFRDFCKWFGPSGGLYCDTSLLPAGSLCAFAREQVGMALCGDAADELFGGYERYQVMKLARLCNHLPERFRKWFFRELIQKYFADAGERTRSGRIRRLCRTLGEAADRQYFSILDRCPAEIAGNLFGDRLKALASPAAAFSIRNTAREAAEKCMELDFHTYLTGDTLPKMVRAAAAASLDVRSPFLDRDVVDFAASLPPEYKICGRQRKYILREAFADTLAPEIFSGRKRGFGTPVGTLLRTAWHRDVPDVLFAESLFRGGWVTRHGVETLWQEHLSGRRDHSYILCNLLVLSLNLGR